MTGLFLMLAVGEVSSEEVTHILVVISHHSTNTYRSQVTTPIAFYSPSRVTRYSKN